MGDNSVLKKLLEDVAKSLGFSSFEIIIDNANDRNGYMSEVVPVTLVDKNSGKDLKLVVKQAQGALLNDEIVVRKAFRNEAFFYKNVFPLLQELGEFNELAPKSYFSSITNAYETYLVFDDLKAQGFENLDKAAPFTRNTMEFVLKRYGKLHAFGYALKYKNPDFFKQLPKETCDFCVTEIPQDEGAGLLHFTKTCLIEDVKPALIASESNPEILKKLEDYIENLGAKYLQAVSSTDRYRTLLHGDCWSNNIMFKMEKDKPIDVRYLDWQLIRIGSPACDLSYAIYSSCTKELLNDLEGLLKVYHASLSANLKNLGYGIEVILPFDELLKQWRSHAKFGMIQSVSVLKAKFSEKDDFESGSIVLQKSNLELYKKTMINLLEHMYEWGVL